MKFTVEVEDFWLDEEELTSALVSHVKRDVVGQISASIKEQVEKQITASVNDVIDEKLKLVIDNTISDLIATNTIIVNSKEKSFIDHIRDRFHSHTGWNCNSVLDRLAKKFGEEMKVQYNAAFANKIVMNMKEQGLLKDEVVQILLEGK